MPEHIFEHLPEVREEIRATSHLLLGLDFDGTLAPIVPRPEDARIPETTRATLDELLAQPSVTMAIVSGRALADLSARAQLNAIFAGNHGLEICGNGFNFHHPDVASRAAGLREICAYIATRLQAFPGSLVEDKGLTATIHYRNAPEAAEAKIAALVRAVVEAHREQFKLREGKKTFEILPRIAWNKGSAMLWILKQLQERSNIDAGSCYIGDDTTDEDAFRAIDGITIRVGDGPTAARFSVRDPDEAAKFLRWMTTAVSGREPQSI